MVHTETPLQHDLGIRKIELIVHLYHVKGLIALGHLSHCLNCAGNFGKYKVHVSWPIISPYIIKASALPLHVGDVTRITSIGNISRSQC